MVPGRQTKGEMQVSSKDRTITPYSNGLVYKSWVQKLLKAVSTFDVGKNTTCIKTNASYRHLNVSSTRPNLHREKNNGNHVEICGKISCVGFLSGSWKLHF